MSEETGHYILIKRTAARKSDGILFYLIIWLLCERVKMLLKVPWS
jgi:hypothetical protein